MRNPARRMAALTVPVLLSLAVASTFAQIGPMPPTPPTAPGGPAMPVDQPALDAAATQTAASQPADTQAAATQMADTQASTQPALGPTTQLVITPPPQTQPRNNATNPRPITASATVAFDFKNAPIEDILVYMSKSLGLTISVDTGINLTDKVQLFMSYQPIGVDEAITDLNTQLAGFGYGTIRTNNTLRVATLANIRAGNVPVHVGADPTKIANTQDIITQVIPLQSVDAVKLRADLAPMLNADAVMTANTGSNSIVVTDTSANIHRMVEIIAALDQQRVAVSGLRTYALKYATASSAATLINTIFASTTTGQGGGGGGGGGNGNGFGRFGGTGFGGRGGGQQGPQQTDTGGSEIQGKVVASSDDRTNTLVVVGPQSILLTVDQIVKQIDENPAQDQIFYVYNLKNGSSDDLEPVLNTLFGNSTSGTSTTARQSFSNSSVASNTSGAFGSTSSSGGRGGGSSSSGFGSTSSSGGRGGGGSSSSGFGSTGSSSTAGRSTGTSGSSRPSSSTATAAGALAGQVFVVSNPDTNSLLITTKAALKDQVNGIIDQLDRPVPQVLIRILIAEVTHTDTDDIGVEFSAVNTRINGKGITAGTDFGIASQTGGLVIGMTEGDITATLRAYATNNKLDVLSRPYILASDNQLASMIVGQEVPIITNTQITDEGNTINSVSYQNVGIILDVTPHINPEGLVIMDITPQVSQLDTGGGVAISSTASAPVIDIRAAQTRVGIKNGETIVIGGMMQDQKTQTIQKIPLLGDIPWLGMLFKRTQNSKTKTELLIFITPHVALVPGYLKGMANDDIQGTKLVPNAVSPGTFQDHLRGLERGATTLPSDDTTTPLTPGKP